MSNHKGAIMNLILLLLASFTFASELEVQGNLKVTGNIDAQNNPITNVGTPQAMTDAVNAQTLNNILTDDGVYEFLFLHIMIYNGDSFSYIFNMQYRLEGENFWNNNLNEYLSIKTQEGWKISSRLNLGVSDNYGVYYLYELKRKIEE